MTTALVLDLSSHEGTATIVLAGAESTGASFEIGDLVIGSVRSGELDLLFEVTAGKLDVGVPPSATTSEITITYAFADKNGFDGWMPGSGVSFLWPYFCGNLFPCKSDPADGVRFTMTVTGAPEGTTVVYPTDTVSEAPAYMPAIAVAPFEVLELAPTSAGTELSVWYLPGQDEVAASGAAHLAQVFEFYEQTLGPYPFGNHAGSVSASWGGGDYGGMEHHPFWHVSSGSMYSEGTQAHEAAHGWFGNGIRIACWEDFVLSEGTVTYLAARALDELGVDLWPGYACNLRNVCDPANGTNTVALPDETCNGIDLLNHPLWGFVPYMKGAHFFRAVAELIGVETLDDALAQFYAAHVGTAARMDDLIVHLHAFGDPDEIDALAEAWLRQLDCPVDYETLCPGD